MVSPYFILHLCKIQVINWNVYSLNVSIRGKILTAYHTQTIPMVNVRWKQYRSELLNLMSPLLP